MERKALLKIPAREVERRLERFKEVAAQAGLKLTHQRLEIYKELARTGEHPDAETLFRRVRKRVPTISRDTVYRTLWGLEELGLVDTLGHAGRQVRFDANVDPHHHFVCTRCGKVEDVSCPDFDGISPPEEVKQVGRVERITVEFRGICAACARKARRGK